VRDNVSQPYKTKGKIRKRNSVAGGDASDSVLVRKCVARGRLDISGMRADVAKSICSKCSTNGWGTCVLKTLHISHSLCLLNVSSMKQFNKQKSL
jgi:hypothetical protein